MPTTAIRVPLARIRLGRLDDERLAALAGAGDERAFEVLYDRYHRALLGFCRHMLRSHHEAEDALQQTFLRAHGALRTHGAPEELRPWLFTIARNRCKTLLSARRPDTLDVDEAEPVTEGLGADVERRADLRALLADVERLPEDQRSALVLAELADLSHAEIATVIGVPTHKVKALVHQARTRLIAEREARDTPCADVREELATARGGALRRGPLRRHLRGCGPCRAYRAAVAEQRTALGLLLPVLPSVGLKETIFGAISGGGGGTAAAAGGIAAGVSTGGGALTGGGAAGIAAKLAVGAALAGSAGGGAVLAADVAQKRDASNAAAVRAAAVDHGAARGTRAVAIARPVPAATAPGRREGTAGEGSEARRTPKAERPGRRYGANKPKRTGKPGKAGAPSSDRGRAYGRERGRAYDRERNAASPVSKPVPPTNAVRRGTYRPKPAAAKPRAADPTPATDRGAAPKPAKPVKPPMAVPAPAQAHVQPPKSQKPAESPAAELLP